VPDLHHVLTFAAAAVVLIVVPGPSVLFIISRGVSLGRQAAVMTVAGNTLGVFVQVLAVSAGLGALVARSIALFTTIKLVGAGYLVYLGVQAFRHRRRLAEALDVPTAPMGLRRVVREGFVVGLSNPKAIVFFAAVLPQFVQPSRGHAGIQMAGLGLVFCAIAIVSDGTWALVSGTAREWLGRKPERLSVIGGAGGLAIIGLGVRLALTGRKD